MGIPDNLFSIQKDLPPGVTLVVVSKKQTEEKILEVYQTGHRSFGENRVQDLLKKRGNLPQDIQWHLIGHLQTNKVKLIAPFIQLIHSVDRLKLLQEIDKCALQNKRILSCLLEVRIAKEDTKFGMTFPQALEILNSPEYLRMKNVKITGFMGMATQTEDEQLIRAEFDGLFSFFNSASLKYPDLKTLSMGMSGDYMIALKSGSNMLRIGSSVFI